MFVSNNAMHFEECVTQKRQEVDVKVKNVTRHGKELLLKGHLCNLTVNVLLHHISPSFCHCDDRLQ